MKEPVKPLHLPLIGKITQNHSRNFILTSTITAVIIAGHVLSRSYAENLATGLSVFFIYLLLALAIFQRSKIAIFLALIMTGTDIVIGILRGASFNAILVVTVYFIIFLAGAIGIFVYQSKSSEKQGFEHWKGWPISLAAILVSALFISVFTSVILKMKGV